MRRILFVAYGGGHVRMLLPVARAVREAGLAEPVFVGLTTARAEVEAAGFRVLGFADVLRGDDELARREGERLADSLATHAVSREESVAYLGLSYAELVEDHGEFQAAQRYAAIGRQAFLPVRAMRRFLEREQPALVVATSAPRAERAAVLASRECGIPALCLVDLFAAFEVEWLREPGFADRVCVLNEHVRQRLVDAGRPAADVVVTGNPAFDTLRDPAVRARGLALRHARGWDHSRVWLWASQVEPASHPHRSEPGDPLLPRRILQELQRITAARPDMQLVVRPHPSEGDFDVALGERQWLSARAESLHELLHACDGVVVLTSTVGLEAHLAGCHVVQALGSLYSGDTPYLAFGVADAAAGIAGLASAIDALPPTAAARQRAPQALATPLVLRQVEALL